MALTAGKFILPNGAPSGGDQATQSSTNGDAEVAANTAKLTADETNVVAALDGATITSATVVGADKIIGQDAGSADALRTFTAQSIADLASASSGDVVGPAVSVDGRFALFDLTTGKLIKQDSSMTSDGSGGITGVVSMVVTTINASSITLDFALASDGTYSGMTAAGTGGATIAVGDLVTLDKDDSRWELVDISVAAAATGDARGLLGIAVTSSTDGTAITVLLNGTIRADANFPALTIGAPVYASTTGDVVVTQPVTTDYVIRILGQAITADSFYFNPSPDWTTHT